jgi:hypothetical protein
MGEIAATAGFLMDLSPLAIVGDGTGDCGRGDKGLEKLTEFRLSVRSSSGTFGK